MNNALSAPLATFARISRWRLSRTVTTTKRVVPVTGAIIPACQSSHSAKKAQRIWPHCETCTRLCANVFASICAVLRDAEDHDDDRAIDAGAQRQAGSSGARYQTQQILPRRRGHRLLRRDEFLAGGAHQGGACRSPFGRPRRAPRRGRPLARILGHRKRAPKAKTAKVEIA